MSLLESNKRALVCAGQPASVPSDAATNFIAKPPVSRGVLLGIADQSLAQRLTAEIAAFASPVTVASSLALLRELAASSAPAIIFLDSDLFGGKLLSGQLPQLAAIAPVLVLGSVNSQSEIARFVASGNVEFIGRVGDFVPLAAALIERGMRLSKPPQSSSEVNWPSVGADMGSVFRHEINNPLTGILGNAELVLARRENFSPVEVQRLQTVVDLAVRLRESIRRISNAWERDTATPNSA
jgi:signal transduction histidine kinase